MIKTSGGFLISKIKQVQGRVFERLLTKSGISEFNGAQGRILFILWNNDNLPIVKVAKQTGLAKTTLTSMLDRLEAADFIKRNYDDNDRRCIRIALTEKAKALQKKYEDVSDEMSELFYDGFTNQEIIQFESMLGRILLNLEKQEH